MSDDPLDYPRMVREALLDVPRQALRLAAREGLPGEHHFYVSFRAGDPGVSRFGGAPERLHVPYAALTAFADPSAEFGLRFDRPGEARVVKAGQDEAPDETGPTEGVESAGEDGARRATVVDIRAFRRSERAEEEPEPAS